MTNEYFAIRESKIHHKGGFARKFIPKGTKVAIYLGEKISKEEGTRRLNASIEAHNRDPHHNAATYIFELNDDYDVDGDVPENDAKYINHSCEPNCEVDIIGDEIIYAAIKDIQAGEELTINYGYEIDDDFREHKCKCGAPSCLGYMVAEEELPKLKEILAKENKT